MLLDWKVHHVKNTNRDQITIRKDKEISGEESHAQRTSVDGLDRRLAVGLLNTNKHSYRRSEFLLLERAADP
jgi:hypothetical protein